MELANLLYGQGEQQPAQGGVPAVPAGVMAAPAIQAPIQAPEPTFTEKLRSDPAMMQSMLMMGARLMQTSGYSQDPMKDIGDAVMIGSATHNMMKENEYNNARADAEARRQNALTDAQIGQTQANTDRITQETAQSAETFPETKKKLALEMKKLVTEGRRAEALALKDEFNSDPRRLAQAWDLDVAKDRASISASGASAASSMSNVEFNRERTKGARLENSAFETLANPLADDRAVEAASRGLNKGKTDKSTAKAGVNQTKELLKEAHPDWTDTEIAAEALAISGSSKTDPTRVALKILEDPEGYDPAVVDNAKQTLSSYVQQASTRGNSRKPGAPAAAASNDKAAWEKARNSVAPGEMYTGPDEQQYRRGK